MTSNKVLFTYKRKRFRSCPKLVNDDKIDASPDCLGDVSSASSSLPAQFDSSNKKLNVNDSHCFKCSSVDVNQNVVFCDGCSRSYHLQCIDSSSKFLLDRQWECLACGKRCDFEESMQIDINTSSNNAEKLGTIPMKFPSIKDFQDEEAGFSMEIAQIDSFSEADQPTYKLKENKLPDDSGDCVVMVNRNLNELAGNDVHPKEKISFLTFSRRAKKKQGVVKESCEKVSNVTNKQTLIAEKCSYKLGGSGKIPDLSIISDDSLGQPDHSPLHELCPNILDKSGESKATIAEGSREVKVAADICEGPASKCSVTKHNLDFYPQSHASTQPVEFDSCCLLSSVMLPSDVTVAAADALVHQSKPSVLDNTETSIRQGHGNKLVKGRMLEFLLDSQSSSTGNCAQLLGNSSGLPNKKMKSAETFDQELLDLNIEGRSPTWVEEISLSCGRAANAKFSNLPPLNSSIQCQFQERSRDCTQHNFISHEKIGVTRSEYSVCERQQLEERSIASFSTANFLGLSLPSNVEVVRANLKDYRSALLSLDLSANNRQSNLFKKYNMVSPAWSEEELDSLWVGVRRHGLNNWNAIFRDPNLWFLKSRVPEELAEQWDREEIKLFNGTRAQQVRQSRQNLSVNSSVTDVCMPKPSKFYQYGTDGSLSSYSSFQTSRLSLGDLFLQRESSKGQTPNIEQSRINPRTSRIYAGSFDSAFLGSTNNVLAGVGNQKDTRFKNNRYDCESSTAFKKSVETFAPDHQSANNSLPHWLKDVIDTPSRATKLQLAPAVPSIPNTFANSSKQNTFFAGSTEASIPTKSSRQLREMMKTKGAPGSNSHVRKFSTSVMTNKHSDKLVVIDSDASSEETISDH